jgi:hypothetical protein
MRNIIKREVTFAIVNASQIVLVELAGSRAVFPKDQTAAHIAASWPILLAFTIDGLTHLNVCDLRAHWRCCG